MLRNLLLFISCAAAGCVVNPDADKSLRQERRVQDSMARAERGVQPLAPDTGQHAMPSVPVDPGASDMPVVNPVDSTGMAPM